MNEEQACFFESFGYVVIRQLFDTNDLAVLAREFHAGLDAQYPADRNDGAERLWTRLTDEDTPFAASLMEDRRFLGPAQRLCGPDVLGIGIDVNRYVGNTGWHPDTADENQVAVKFIFYLDAVDADAQADAIGDQHRRDESQRCMGHLAQDRGDIGEDHEDPRVAQGRHRERFDQPVHRRRKGTPRGSHNSPAVAPPQAVDATPSAPLSHRWLQFVRDNIYWVTGIRRLSLGLTSDTACRFYFKRLG